MTLLSSPKEEQRQTGLWSSSRIAVVGASGFVGRSLVRQLATRSEPVRAIARRFEDPVFEQQGIEMVRADFSDFLSVARALDGVDTVVQLVNSINPSSGNSRVLGDIEHELIPQVRFLEACVQARVRRVVFISSGGAVYGNATAHPTPETCLPLPQSSYGLIKLTTERYLELFRVSHGLDYICLRMSNIYGPGQTFRRGQGLIPAILDRLQLGQPVTIFGDGKAERDYVFVEDAVAAILGAMAQRVWTRPVVNIGGGSSHSIVEVLDLMQEILGRRIERAYVPQRRTDVRRSLLDITLAREVLDWTPTVPLREGLSRTLEQASLRAAS